MGCRRPHLGPGRLASGCLSKPRTQTQGLPRVRRPLWLAEAAAGWRHGPCAVPKGSPAHWSARRSAARACRRRAGAGPLRKGGASARAPDSRAPESTARGGACVRGRDRGARSRRARMAAARGS